jgi:proline iminopeptidase
MKLIITFLLSFSITAVDAQTIYSKAFGNKDNKALIFLHGGPGYNCATFEITTAQRLADEGYYVIVYDRRGEGRSTDPMAKYTFEQTFADLNEIYSKYEIRQASLIGHSFGGVISTLYAEKFPKNVTAVILVGAPVSLQETFKTILNSSERIYMEKKDSVNLNYIRMIRQMDPKSMMYASYSFAHAAINQFYSPKQRTSEGEKVFEDMKKDPASHFTMEMTREAPQGFLKNENYTSIDLSSDLADLTAQKKKIFAVYGKEDGLYSPQQVSDTEKLIGKQHVKYWDDCSHSVFIDQQTRFIDTLNSWVR